jgi:tetratricopeptide (TPR) repeat protein
MTALVERRLDSTPIAPDLRLIEAALRSYFIVGQAEYDLADEKDASARLHLSRAQMSLEKMAKYLRSARLVDFEIGYHLTIGLVHRKKSLVRGLYDLRSSIRHFERARELAKKSGDAVQEADALFDLSDTLIMQGKIRAAQSHLLSVLAAFEYLGDADPLARAMSSLADSIERTRNQPISLLRAAGVFRKLSVRIRKSLGMDTDIVKKERKKLKLLRYRLLAMGVSETFERPLKPEAGIASGSKTLCKKANHLLKYFRSTRKSARASGRR